MPFFISGRCATFVRMRVSRCRGLTGADSVGTQLRAGEGIASAVQSRQELESRCIRNVRIHDRTIQNSKYTQERRHKRKGNIMRRSLRIAHTRVYLQLNLGGRQGPHRELSGEAEDRPFTAGTTAPVGSLTWDRRSRRFSGTNREPAELRGKQTARCVYAVMYAFLSAPFAHNRPSVCLSR